MKLHHQFLDRAMYGLTGIGSPSTVAGYGAAVSGSGLHTGVRTGPTLTTITTLMDGTYMMATGPTKTAAIITGTTIPITKLYEGGSELQAVGRLPFWPITCTTHHCRHKNGF